MAAVVAADVTVTAAAAAVAATGVAAAVFCHGLPVGMV